MSNPNLGRPAPYIEFNVPDGEALDLRFRNDDDTPKDSDGPQRICATVISFGNPDDLELNNLGVEATNRVVAVFDTGMGDNYLVSLGNDALTTENVMNRLRQGEYTKALSILPRPETLQEIHQARHKGLQLHQVINNEGYVDLVTADQDKVVLATKAPADISEVVFNSSADSLLNGNISLKMLSVTIDDESWSLVADHLEEKIKTSEHHRKLNLPPALGNVPPLFKSTPLDLSLMSLADRLEVIDNFRRDNEGDLRTAMEVIELIVARKHNRPANKDRITEASWDGATLEERAANESPDDLGAEFESTMLRLDRLQQDLVYQVLDDGVAKWEDLMIRDVLRCEMAVHRELGEKYQKMEAGASPS